MSVVDHLSIETRTGLGIATIMARKGVSADRIGAALGLTISNGPSVSGSPALSLIGTGPGVWLALAEQAKPDFAEEMAKTLCGIASVSDQSSSYSVTRLSGAGARTALQRGAAIDFHPDEFKPGSAATTVISHIGVIIWQVDDRPTYDVATFRSFAGSFRHWLDVTAAAL